MTREWAPGDVAMVMCSDGVLRRAMLRPMVNGASWQFSDGALRYCDESDARPLVVIDPEDREQVEQLTRAYWRTADDLPTRQGIDNMQTVLREFANPTQPKPDEPTGLGAVVEDADGCRWVRWSVNWARAGAPAQYRAWGEINAVRVLSEGVQ